MNDLNDFLREEKERSVAAKLPGSASPLFHSSRDALAGIRLPSTFAAAALLSPWLGSQESPPGCDMLARIHGSGVNEV